MGRKNTLQHKKKLKFLLDLDLIQGPLACEPSMLPLSYRDILIWEAKSFELYNVYKNGYIFTFGYFQGAI